MFQSKHGSRTTKHSGSHSLHGTDEESPRRAGSSCCSSCSSLS